MDHIFPSDFIWGCGTAAHQVEGNLQNDWTIWEQAPSHIFENQKVGRACAWWEGLYLEDFDRALQLHNNSFRLSIEWSRVEPEPGKWDEGALAHYRDMLRALQMRGLAP